jgi:hypothetical protein
MPERPMPERPMPNAQCPMPIPQMNMPWVDSPFFSQLLERSSLDDTTKKLAQQFAEDGYVIFDPEIEDFDRLAEEIIQSLTPEYLHRQADRIQDA